MIFKKRITAFLLSAMLMLPFLPVNAEAEEDNSSVRGIEVNSADNLDFPSKSNLSVSALRKEMDEITDFAEENNFNSLFLEIRPGGTAIYKSKVYPTSHVWLKEEGNFSFYDPAADFVKRAAKKNIGVFAVVDVNMDGDVETAVEDNIEDFKHIGKKYKFAGVVLKNLPKEGINYDTLLKSFKKALGKINLGVMADTSLYSGADMEKIASSCDFLIPVINEELSFRNHEGYIKTLKELSKINSRIVPYTDISSLEEVSPTLSSKHFEALKNGFDNYLFNNYSSLRDNKNAQMSLLSTVSQMEGSISSLKVGYDPKKTFSITRPTKGITTPYSSYSILGTSDPDQALYFKGQKVDRVSEDGLFSINVPLKPGNNTFYIAQAGKTEQINIRRSTGGGSPALINKITKAFPVDSAIMRNNDTMEINCVAPSGGKITAEINGKTVALKQSAQAQRGVPAVYRGSFTMDGADSEQVKSIGNIEYTLLFNGAYSSYTSKGEVYLAGEDARIMAETDIIFANVLTPELVFGYFKSIYKEGTREEIVGMTYEDGAWYYELKSGGFIKASDVKISESESREEALDIEEIAVDHDDNREIIRLCGIEGIPYYFDEKEDGSTVLNLFGEFSDSSMAKLYGLSDMSFMNYSSVSAEKTEQGAAIEFVPLDKNDIWGLDIIYDGSDSLIMTRAKPKLSDNSAKPLENLTVVLDPGHGDIDSGALGVLGTDGPNEKNVNLLNAKLLRERLSMLGANVILTRETDEENPTLLERANEAYLNDADIFISMHHNSIAEAADGNKFSGVEAYYYEDFGKNLATLIPQKISSSNAGREYRKTENGYYVVTKIRSAPALLCEIGFMPSPYEYERVCDKDEMFKTSEAITAAIIEAIS